MNIPDPGPGPGPASSVFDPPAPAAPPASPPPAADKASAQEWQAFYTVMAGHHGICGRLDILGRRLAEVLDGHASLVAHVTDQAPAASASTQGGTAFWGQVLDHHHVIHGLLKAAEAEARALIAEHGGLIAALEQLL